MNIIAIIRQTSADSQPKQDLAAVEAALRYKRQSGGFVTALCLGTEAAVPLLREAVAMGCDSAALIRLPFCFTSIPEPTRYARLLAGTIQDMEFDLIFTSCYAVDADTIQTGFLLASYLNLPQAGYVDETSVSEDSGVIVKRQFEDRYQMLNLPTPCLISALLQPGKRIYMTADGVTRAYAMEIPVIPACEALNAGEESFVTLLSSCLKKERKRGTVLTVPTEEAISAVMDIMHKNHII